MTTTVSHGAIEETNLHPYTCLIKPKYMSNYNSSCFSILKLFITKFFSFVPEKMLWQTLQFDPGGICSAAKILMFHRGRQFFVSAKAESSAEDVIIMKIGNTVQYAVS